MSRIIKNKIMLNKLTLSLIIILSTFYSKLLVSEEASLNPIETGGYCECGFYSEKNSPFKISIGWPGIQDKPVTWVNINGKEYKNLKKKYEKFKPTLNSKGEFLLSNDNISLKGSLTVISDCRNTGNTCEYTKFKGNLNIKNNSKSENHSITGGCGC